MRIRMKWTNITFAKYINIEFTLQLQLNHFLGERCQHWFNCDHTTHGKRSSKKGILQEEHGLTWTPFKTRHQRHVMLSCNYCKSSTCWFWEGAVIPPKGDFELCGGGVGGFEGVWRMGGERVRIGMREGSLHLDATGLFTVAGVLMSCYGLLLLASRSPANSVMVMLHNTALVVTSLMLH